MTTVSSELETPKIGVTIQESLEMRCPQLISGRRKTFWLPVYAQCHTSPIGNLELETFVSMPMVCAR